MRRSPSTVPDDANAPEAAEASDDPGISDRPADRSGSTTFRRELGLFDTTMVVAGAIIGVGIFVNPSNVARILPSPTWMLIAWTVGGLLALAGGFLYAELGSRMPEVGGQYVYLSRAFGPWAGSIYGYSLLLVINAGGIAAVASVMASYFDRSFFALSGAGRALFAVSVLVVLTEINVRGVRPGKRTNNLLMALKLLGIATLFAFGLYRLGAARALEPALTGGTQSSFSLFFAALVPILFAYGGWQNCGSIAAEIRDPGRTLARANVLGVALVVLAYLGLNLLYLAVLTPAEMAATDALAADVASRLIGAAGASFIGVLIVVSCIGFLSVIILTGPRLYCAMARDGLLPRRAGALHPRFGTPAFAIRLQTAVALVLLLSQSYGELLSYVVFGDWLFFAATAAGLFVLRHRDGTPAGVFRNPGHPFTTLLFIAVGLAVVVNSFFTAPVQTAAGCGAIGLGAVAVAWKRRQQVAR